MKRLFLALILLFFTTCLVFSQERIEVIHLKNGSIIKGEIVEFKPNQYLKIETDNGSSIICEYNNIDKILREKPNKDDSTLKAKSNKDNFLTKGYRGFVYGNVIIGNLIGGSLTSIHGAQLNNHIFLGGGTGLRIANDFGGDHIAIPIFANFRYDICNYFSTPYLELSAGISVPISGEFGFYAATSVGCRIKYFSFDLGVEFAPGVDEYVLEYDPYNTYYSPYNGYNGIYTEKYTAFSLVAKIGYEF